MSKTKHSPGPWTGTIPGPKSGLKYNDVVSADREHVARVYSRCDLRLVAAAPELLEALKECADMLEHQYRVSLGEAVGTRKKPAVDKEVAEHVTLKRARAAIAKAAGKT